MLKQTQVQKQTLKLTPQQIQLMKLLQIPVVSLEERVKEEIEKNPVLEEANANQNTAEEDYNSESTAEDQQEKDFELDEYLQNYIDDDPYSYKLRGTYDTGDEEEKTIPLSVETSLREYLEEQIHLLELEEEEELIALQLIGSIEDDGYLRRDLSSIVDDLMFAQNLFLEKSDIEAVLKKIQSLDPPGIGARDLRENLMIQLRSKLEREKLVNFDHVEAIALAYELLNKEYNLFIKKHFQKLKDALRTSDEKLKLALEEITKLNPKPASGFSSGKTRGQQYINPDFYITNRGGKLELSLNRLNAPELKVSDHYQAVLKSYQTNSKKGKASRSEKDTVQFIKQRIDSAKWFIDAISQRQATLLKTMTAIMNYQADFFLTGDALKLRPMILKDIAEITDLDISTISRVVNSKYVQTEYGIKSLKEFFSEGMTTNSGEEVSTIEVKKVLEEVIANENKRKPLSDKKLEVLLRDKGYNIARRTVAKYREQLNIPVARLRKEL